VAARPGVLGTDFRPEEVLAAVAGTGAIPVAVVVITIVAELLGLFGRPLTGMPEVDRGLGEPIRVKPVVDMDSPLLKLGGKAQLPKEWEKPEPDPQTPVREQTAVVSPQAKDDPNAIPDKDTPLHTGDAGPDPDAEVVKDGEQASTDAGTEAAGGGSPAGSKDGTETDPLKGRAASRYHGMILGFLKAGFVCPQLPEGAPKCSPSASVTIAGDLTVTSVSFSPCGVPEIDSAAGAAANSKKGQSIPPPPENYPELQPSSFAVTYVCK
jgi:hypothetical protein